MKKLILPIGIAVIIILAIVGFLILSKRKVPAPTPATMAPVTATKSATIFSSIQDALSKSLSLTCTFNQTSGVMVKAYIKNGMIREDITASDVTASGSVIIRDKKMYFWNSKSAIVMAIPDTVSVTPGKTAAVPSASALSPQDAMKNLEMYKDKCKAENVSDDLFVIPTNVKFQDLSAMMKGITVPTGAAASAMPSSVPSQYQQIINQYQNQASPTQ